MAALFLPKGSGPHRLMGNIFFGSMLLMSGAGAYMATFRQPLAINVIAGLLTFYLVASAWLTVRRNDNEVGRPEYGVLLIGLLAIAVSAVFGWKAAHVSSAVADGAPLGAYVTFGSIGLLAVGGDVRLFIQRGVSGAKRIARHTWRMCFALTLATSSLFIGTPNRLLLPALIRDTGLRFLPIAAVVAASFFWLLRIWRRSLTSSRTSPQPLLP
jgi:hypothetical protein